ncbi:hypothetical protein CGRA01v4_12487 [Colletotrichum graminicola]|nr:hypothetical protein CGRA01v4_12487 [Colletotrichum graminicola]
MACIAVYLLFLLLFLPPHSLSPGTYLLARRILQSHSEWSFLIRRFHFKGESHG